ncbi:MAG: two-component system response regulator [Bacteroidetes bacterium RIFOXYA12_FULL_35_11]|nr:MAG: two-component system response regulator [Bacteroidetes bacterium GWF2_35_48]OFY75679.1 MAG: two-component system response regulator [Bacteroidetes bacterium RIFOXYA12_FULL_35_11]OFZ01285.1 MAG: two-component system response regulator [Bacteroidetes bacterium RIFOXYC12_FULL_35_7]HBX50934.1 DNA-binding response regulator [Bacteroidales bacterium]
MNSKIHILLVEDDENLGFILKDFLEMQNYMVDLRKNGAEGLFAFKAKKFDLCLLDIMMPIKDGFTLATEIKEINENIPIIFLTAKEFKEDKIRGFKIGADDYITKPFSTEELNLRIQAILRRYRINAEADKMNSVFQIGAFIFDAENQTLAFHNGDLITLTKKEAELLKVLCLNINSVVKRETALKKVWGTDDYFMGRSMDVYITKLRKYLKNDSCVSIQNIHGTGFKLEVEEK